MDLVEKLTAGNRAYLQQGNRSRREETAQNGQHPYAIVICCSDSRVIPEQIFGADIGDLFVIRVAGNVLDRHQLGSIEYAAMHLHCGHIIVLGHTGCGAVAAALSGHCEGYIRYIADEILLAAGDERDENVVGRLNVLHAVERIRQAFREHPEIPTEKLDVRGAIYDIESGEVEWLT